MRTCKNCGPLPDSNFSIRVSGYIPNVCLKCERRAATRRRKEAYSDPEKREAIRRQNAAWRSKNAKSLAVKAQIRHSAKVYDGNVGGWANSFSDEAEMLLWARSGGFLPKSESVSSVFDKLKNVVMQDPLPQSHVGLGYLDNVNPHRYLASTEDKPSVSKAFSDDAEILKVISYILSTNRTPTRDLILRNLKFNVRMPAHFYPSAATAVMNEYARGGDVFDPFAGWGGRALGAMCSDVRSYCGTDAQKLSIDGILRIASDFAHLSKVSATATCSDFSHFMLETDARFDFVMTSPPFFDTENYGMVGAKGRDWVANVAKPLVDGVSKVLKPNGLAAMHAQDRPKVAVMSIMMAGFLGAGFEVFREHKYGRRPGQAVLVFKRRP